MDWEEKKLIVTDSPIIEIDGRFFQDIFEAEKYLVRSKWMRVPGARRRVQELVNIALDRPIDEGRRDFLKWVLGTSVAICQWLWEKVADNWARDFWKNLSSSHKNKARRNYLQDFLPATSKPYWRGNYDLSLLKLFTESPACVIPRLDDMIVRDLPQARSSVFALRNLVTNIWSFPHLRVHPYKDTDTFTYLGELGCWNVHRSSVSSISQDTLKNRITNFYTIVDANSLLQHTFDRGYVELTDIMWDFTEEVTNQDTSSFMYFTRRLHDSWWTSPDLRDSNEALRTLTDMRERIAGFLGKHSKQSYPRFNFEQLMQVERAQKLREIQSDPNWYHAREILSETPVRHDKKGKNPEITTPNSHKYHTPEVWLGAFDGMIKIAEIFEIK